MYGFHKKVGLSDNSMRASERKNKTPSEYSNPYFRRGHPDLLYLIQKPKTTTGKKGRKADVDQAEEDIDEYVDDLPVSDTRIRPRPQLTLGQGDSNLSSEQFSTIQRELRTIKQQQNQIQHVMARLRADHQNLVKQANTYQDYHSRHENSINAILTFLATVYNRSLQGHEDMPGIQNLFAGAGAIPNEQPSGTVVDVGDYTFDNLAPDSNSPAKPFRRAPLLLTDGTQQGRASTMSPSTANSPYPPRQSRRPSRSHQTPQATVEELFDPGDTPNQMQQQQDIMNVINDSNARNSTPSTNADFSNMISDLQNSGGNNPLNANQRADMLRLIHNTGGNPSNGDNALINATPPAYPTNFDRQLADSKATYDSLAKMQAEQDKAVQNLTNLLQPLSPSGSIPGIHDDTNLPPAPWNVDDFLNADHDYFDGLNGSNFDLNATDNNVAAPAFNDYDDMFTTVPNISNNDGNNGNGTNNLEVEDRGRVESASIASSEVATPESAAAASNHSANNSPLISNKQGRQNFGGQQQQQSNKRTRRG
jgi:heat shock transcription factor, other eukaryote